MSTKRGIYNIDYSKSSTDFAPKYNLPDSLEKLLEPLLSVFSSDSSN